jgi:hypothetical protein
VCNALGDDVKYTCNVALMFYNNLAQYIHNQIKASVYLPPETFSDNSSQAQAMCALQYFSLKAEMEVTYIINISKRSKRASNHACFPEDSLTKQLFPSPSSYAPVMVVSQAMSVRNQLFPSPPNFHPSTFHEHPVLTCHTPSDQDFVQCCEVYAQCNRSITENALQKAHSPSEGSLDSDTCWGCAGLYPIICFHHLRVCPHRDYPRF